MFDEIFKPCLECDNGERQHLRWLTRDTFEPPPGAYIDVILCTWCDLETWYLHYPNESGGIYVGKVNAEP